MKFAPGSPSKLSTSEDAEDTEPKMPTLPRSEVDDRLKRLQSWKLEGNAIRKQFTFAGFPEAIAFVGRVDTNLL